MTPSDHWKKRLEQTPALAAYLRPIAQKWASGKTLPKNITLGAEPQEPALREALGRLFGQIRYRNQKMVATLPAALRRDAELAALAEQLGIQRKAKKTESIPVQTILQRIRLVHPHPRSIHRWMALSPEINRLLTNNPQQETLLLGLLRALDFLAKDRTPTTLSSLGSKFFNDSKILRNKKSVPYALLADMAIELLGLEEAPVNRSIALEQFGVVDNPATTTAILFGALTLVRNGQPDAWIADRFRTGEPVTLNRYNLDGVEAIRLPGHIQTVITSENAAPFHELVQENPQAVVLYTGGYPNAVVCRLLQLLHEAGATCRHWGDSDPDGLIIADLLGRYIETSLFRCNTDEILRHANQLKPLTGAALLRGRSYLKNHPDFAFKEELSLALQTEHWLEQERWQPPPTGKNRP